LAWKVSTCLISLEELTGLQIKLITLDGRVTDNDALNTTGANGLRDVCKLILVKVWRDLDYHFRPHGSVHLESISLFDDLPQQPTQEVLALQAAESRCVWRRHIDDEDIGVGTEQPDTANVVLVRVGCGRLVLAEVHTKQLTRSQRTGDIGRRKRDEWQWIGEFCGVRKGVVADTGLQLMQRLAVAKRVEAIAVNTSLIFFQTEESRLGVSGLFSINTSYCRQTPAHLWLGCDTSNFNVAETEVKQAFAIQLRVQISIELTVYCFSILVESSGEPDGVLQLHIPDLHIISVC
jgi:hypothetical protein